ncbi:two-component sensor histidine kinase [Sinorhizobium medicae]|nr:HAMP domain-containing sensor histidine kinase [Sinorhizobium medicae]PLU29003.1 two-component sensor histidine kinase [Sinorhizobium medicae]
MRLETRSLAGRLVLSLSLLLAVFWTIAVGLSIHVMRAEFDEVFDSALQETTERLASLVVDDYFRRDAGTGPNQVAALDPGATDEYLTYQVRDAYGRVLLHSHNIGTEPYPAPLKPGFWSGNERRIFTIATVSDTTRDGSNLEPIVLQGLPTEIAAIPGSVNTLLGRLKLALQAERDLAANSAHELRTPLAGALAQMELLADQLTAPDDRSRSDRVLGALRRLSLMLEKLLQLSRADAGIGVSSTPVDLLALVKLLVESFQRSHQTSTIQLRTPPGPATLLRAVDPDAFAIAFNNLLENAARYGTAGQPITVAISADGRFTVTNPVSVLLDPDLDVYRARFRRGQTSKPGSGLGLAIVDKLMAQMDGTMILRTVKLSGERTGFECELSLPPTNQ